MTAYVSITSNLGKWYGELGGWGLVAGEVEGVDGFDVNLKLSTVCQHKGR